MGVNRRCARRGGRPRRRRRKLSTGNNDDDAGNVNNDNVAAGEDEDAALLEKVALDAAQIVEKRRHGNMEEAETIAAAARVTVLNNKNGKDARQKQRHHRACQNKSRVQKRPGVAVKEAEHGNDGHNVLLLSGAAPPPAPNTRLAPLLEMCPPYTPPELVEHVVQVICSGDVNEAAMYLLSDGSLEKAQASLDAQRKREKVAEMERIAEDLKAREKDRKRIIARFDEKVIVSSNTKKSNRASSSSGKKGKRGSKKGIDRIRYLDGRIVTKKGEKNVVVSAPPEWDGGSRGRVKTKGKRGVGWV